MTTAPVSLKLSCEKVGLPNLTIPLMSQQPLPEAPHNLIRRAAAAAAAASRRVPPPILIADALEDDFAKQINAERLAFVRKNCDPLIASSDANNHSTDFSNKNELVDAWCHLYDSTWAEYANGRRTAGATDNQLVSFVDSYLSLAASPSLSWIFNEVQRLSTEWAELLLKQKTEAESLEKEHKKLVDSLAMNAVDAPAINMAAREHFEARERLKHHQRADAADLHRALSQRLRLGVIAKASAHRVHRSESTRSPTASVSAMDDSLGMEGRFPSGSDVSFTASSLRQDCFTIALGTQVRSTANVKLLSADLTDIVKSVAHVPKAQWLHNIMTMYSTDQSALVVMVDGDLSLFNEPISSIRAATKPVPELHFASYSEQIKEVTSLARKNRPIDSSLPVQGSGEMPVLEAGDFFATRHSNLSGIDVVFHLVWSEPDPRLKAPRSANGTNLLDGGEITSRHPVIGGLRTLIRTCLEHDITSITVPLLLTTSTRLPESATLAWCARRAELVLKCIKGYLLEHTNNSGASSTACCFAGGIPLGTTAAELTAPGGRPPTIQFLVPKEVSDELFSILTQQVTQIFRVSSPLVLQVSLPQKPPNGKSNGGNGGKDSNDKNK